MKLDRIHDLQRIYRNIVDITSFPGTTTDLSAWARRVQPEPPFNPVLMLFAFCLLDREVRFAFRDAEPPAGPTGAAGRLVSELTAARPASPYSAQYVFITRNAPDRLETLGAAPVGSLDAPHLGATVILEVSRIGFHESGNGNGDGQSVLLLEGPGVKSRRMLAGVWPDEWVGIRNEKTQEFPLGIDVFLVDRAGVVAAVPRSTQVTEAPGARSEAWDT